MESFALSFPILPGKPEEARAFAAEVAGPRAGGGVQRYRFRAAGPGVAGARIRLPPVSAPRSLPNRTEMGALP